MPIDHSSTSPIVAAQSGASTIADGQNTLTAWHYGNPLMEQSALEKPSAVGLIDGWDRVALKISGTERLDWLNSLISQKVNAMQPGQFAQGLILSAQGHVEQIFGITATDDALILDVDQSQADALETYLTRMVFWAQVKITRLEWARLSLITKAGRGETWASNFINNVDAQLVTNNRLGDWAIADIWVPAQDVTSAWSKLAQLASPTGAMAVDALRIEARVPTIGDLDEKTIPHEIPAFMGSNSTGATQLEVSTDGPSDGAVHLNKGCYRGQETVSRVQNLGKPPRTLVLLNLDGSANRLPEVGAELTAGGRSVGRVGTSVHHSDFGPIALALVKRAVVEKLATDPSQVPPLLADGIDAAIDPADIVKDDREAPGRAAIKKLRTN